MARFFINISLLLLATFVALPAWSQIYKWVDENGVVNYASHPPSNGNAEELDLNSAPLSVIETDKPEQLAALAAKSEISSLRQKVNQLESELEAQRYARQYAVEPVAAPVSDQYVYPGYLYAPANVVFIRHHLRKPHIIPTQFIQTPKGTSIHTPMKPMHSFHGMWRAGFPGQKNSLIAP